MLNVWTTLDYLIRQYCLEDKNNQKICGTHGSQARQNLAMESTTIASLRRPYGHPLKANNHEAKPTPLSKPQTSPAPNLLP